MKIPTPISASDFFHYLASKLENAFALSCLTSVPSTVFILDIKLKVLADTVGMDSLLTASQHAFISINASRTVYLYIKYNSVITSLFGDSINFTH